MKYPVPSIVNTKAENRTLYRLRDLEQQVAQLTRLLDVHGIRPCPCEICSELIWNKQLYCYGLRQIWLNAMGLQGIMIRKGDSKLYYCAEHLPEAYEQMQDWDDNQETNSALNTIALWVLRHRTKDTPQRSRDLINVPDIQERCRILAP